MTDGATTITTAKTQKRAERLKEVGRTALDSIMQKPGLAYGSAGTLGGALLVFLLNGQGEAEKQDTAILDAIAEQTQQITRVLDGQRELRNKLENTAKRLEALERAEDYLGRRQERLEREQRETLSGQLKLRGEVTDWMRHQGGHAPAPQPVDGELVAVVAAELRDLQAAGATDIWTARGPPYARAGVLTRRLNRHVSADVRDQAAALLTLARGIRAAEGTP